MQKDLFDSATIPAIQTTKEETSTEGPRFHLTLTLDQVLLIAVFFIIYSSVVFSSGIVSGKKIHFSDLFRSIRSIHLQAAPSKPAPKPDSVENPQAAPSSVPNLPNSLPGQSSATAQSPEKTAAAEADSQPVQKGKYTIQIIAYKQNQFAQTLMEKLTAKGLDSFILKGKVMHNVCVSNFSTRSQASTFLKKLVSDGVAPKDAYVRVIS